VAGNPSPEHAPHAPSEPEPERISPWRRLVREPLVHFVLLGAAIFAAQALLGGDGASRRIEVDDSLRRALRQDHVRRTGAEPTPAEEAALVESYVDEEILYREALALGLDRGDVIVRRRMLQKMEFLAESAEPIAEPSDADLERFLAENGARYAVPARVALTHVFVGSDRHGESAEPLARELRERLAAGADPATLGDPFPRGRDFGLSSERELAGIFGSELAAAAMRLPAGRWSEPLRSAYGWHLVRPSQTAPGGPPRLADVRQAVRLDLLEEIRAGRRRDALEALREGYEVVLDR
jgi:hypothetical protein